MANALTLPRPRPLLRDVASRVAALWRAYPRESLGIGLLGLVAAATIAVGWLTPHDSLAGAAPPAPPPMVVRPLAPEQAVRLNAEIPVASGPNPAAAAFQFKGTAAARAQALNCLASAVYYEAGNQDADGERAVAQVILNRVRHPAFPGTVCGVVYQGSTRPTGCQFTFTCDGSLNRQPDADGWRRATEVAAAALGGTVYAPVGWATHYHADYVVPYWASTLTKNAVVGAHIFYRWAGGWGKPAAFNESYSGHEPNAIALRNAAVAAAAARPQGENVADAILGIPGAEALPLTPSMRGDKRVAVRFKLAAKKASDEAPHEDYTKTFQSSENLKWALSGDEVAKDEKPLGAAATPAVAAANPAKR